MQKIPMSAWIALTCLALGGLGGGALVLESPKLGVFVATPSVTPSIPSVTPSPSVTTTPSSEESHGATEMIKVLIRDKKSKMAVQDAEVTVAAKEGLSTKPTLTDGTVSFEVPKQTLGEVKVKIVKLGYITQELPKNFSINPREIQNIDLEEDTSNPGGDGGKPSSLPTKIDWGSLKSYFEIDDDVNIQIGGYETVAVHVTARKDFNAVSFRAQPYDAYGVRTNLTSVNFSYSPQKWKKGDRSLVTITTLPNMSKIEVMY